MSSPAAPLRSADSPAGSILPSVVLTIDLEDWNQLVARQAGMVDWDQARPAFPRQVETLLSLLDRTGARATFFVLGMTARRYEDVVATISRCGHAIASHGYAHEPVWLQSRGAFRDDVKRSIDAIGASTGVRPVGYRAPAFSVTRADVWAFEVLAELGFEYDSSQHDSPSLPNPSVPSRAGPHDFSLPSGRTLVEFPPAVVRWAGRRVPFGGGTYWRVLPDFVIRGAVARQLSRGETPTVYFHPYEFDPQPLRLGVSSAHARIRELRYNFRRTGIGARLAGLARRLSLITCEEYLEQHRRTRQASFS